MNLVNPVRVQMDDGQETTVSEKYATAKGLTVLDKPAVSRSGRALPASGHSSAEQVAANVSKEADLKGQALNDALTAAGLSTSGKAEAKRTRLAEHLAAVANVPDPNEPPPGDSEHDAPEGTDQ